MWLCDSLFYLYNDNINVMKRYMKWGYVNNGEATVVIVMLITMSILSHKRLHLKILTTTRYTFSSQFYQKMHVIEMGWPASSTTTEHLYAGAWQNYNTTSLNHLKDWKWFVDDVYLILKRTHLENSFYHIINLYHNINNYGWRKKCGTSVFFKLHWNEIMERYLLVYRKSAHTNQYLHYSSHHQTSCKESIVSSLFNRAYSIITNKNDVRKTLE